MCGILNSVINLILGCEGNGSDGGVSLVGTVMSCCSCVSWVFLRVTVSLGGGWGEVINLIMIGNVSWGGL